jgi:hypothetical protein
MQQTFSHRSHNQVKNAKAGNSKQLQVRHATSMAVIVCHYEVNIHYARCRSGNGAITGANKREGSVFRSKPDQSNDSHNQRIPWTTCESLQSR